MNGLDLMVTYPIVGTTGHSSNTVGNYVVGWNQDDWDADYQDAVLEVSGFVPTAADPDLLDSAHFGVLFALYCSSNGSRAASHLLAIFVAPNRLG